MKLVTVCLTAITVGLLIGGVRADDSAEQKLGYIDTPRLPNSPFRVHDRDRPQAPRVSPGASPGAPPEDAIVLFDGEGLSHWVRKDGSPILYDAPVINILETGPLSTKQAFGSCQFHIEWASPVVADAGPMSWGNSGVYLHGLYELQIIESHDSLIYADGIAAAIYGQQPPLVNASRKPGEWQTFDVVFLAPEFDRDQLVRPAQMTVFWNGVLVQYCQEILGPTRHKLLPEYNKPITKGPITLQKHGSAVRFRNIWIRDLAPEEKVRAAASFRGDSG